MEILYVVVNNNQRAEKEMDFRVLQLIIGVIIFSHGKLWMKVFDIIQDCFAISGGGELSASLLD